MIQKVSHTPPFKNGSVAANAKRVQLLLREFKKNKVLQVAPPRRAFHLRGSNSNLSPWNPKASARYKPSHMKMPLLTPEVHEPQIEDSLLPTRLDAAVHTSSRGVHC